MGAWARGHCELFMLIEERVSEDCVSQGVEGWSARDKSSCLIIARSFKCHCKGVIGSLNRICCAILGIAGAPDRDCEYWTFRQWRLVAQIVNCERLVSDLNRLITIEQSWERWVCVHNLAERWNYDEIAVSEG